jgi:hypothetical protein
MAGATHLFRPRRRHRVPALRGHCSISVRGRIILESHPSGSTFQKEAKFRSLQRYQSGRQENPLQRTHASSPINNIVNIR